MEYRSQSLSRSSSHTLRSRLSALAIVLVLGGFAGRVGYLTLARGEEMRAAALENLESVRRIEAPRGNILDRNGEPVALSRRAWSVTFSRYGLNAESVHETLRLVGEQIGEDLTTRFDEIMETRPSWTRHTLARRLPQDMIVALLERPEAFPGIRLESDYRREYPQGANLAPVVGFVGRIPTGSETQYKRPTYLPDAYVGRAGIELRYEDRLVGKPGRDRLTRDARGRLLEEPEVLTPARAGDDMLLATDAGLQRLAMERLAGLEGSAIVMDARTGDLLVMASAPSFDPLRPWLQELDGRPVSYLNSCTQGRYPPGSTFKMISASAFLHAGVEASESLTCSGNVQLAGWLRPYWCDLRSGHGPTDLTHALQWSCNSYFYRRGLEAGPAALIRRAQEFGYGKATGIDLPGESRGLLHALDSLPGDGETLNLAIGQGRLLATPLQVAVSYAALATAGDVPVPRVVRAIRPAGVEDEEALPTQIAGRVNLGSEERHVLLDALWRAVNASGGTAQRAGFDPAWGVCGKTGTAENAQGTVDAWFACVYPRENPRTVVVVHVVDADGHGGDVAAPIARDLIAAMESEQPEASIVARAE